MLSSKKKEPAPEISARTKATKSRQLAAKKEVISRTGVVLDKCYCRKCMKNKVPIDFFESVDNGLVDSNGKFSVCKECCNDLFERFYGQNNSLEKSLLKTCRIINIRFDDVAVRATLEHVSEMMENDKEVGRIFSVYKAKLMRTQKTSLTNKDTSEDFTFVEPTVVILSNPLDDSVEGAYDLKMFWGESLEHDDYVWLEKELSDWKKTHKSDTKAEETLLKEICYKHCEFQDPYSIFPSIKFLLP